jgi:DNA-binding beta-propeller fold protein YncE
MPLGICCLVSVWLLPGECRASSLYVGNFFGNQSDVLLYNGDTGAFIGTFVPHGSGSLTFPLGGGFGPDGNFYVSNSDNDTVIRYNGSTGVFLNVFASSVGDAAGLVFGPGNSLYVVDSSDPGAVTKLNATTGMLIGELTGGGLSDPEGIAIGPDGNVYVANTDGNDVVRFNGVTGAFMDIFVAGGSGGLSGPRGVTFGADGNLYVTSNGSTGGVLRYNGATGAFLNAFVGPGSDLFLPRQLTFGPDGNLYVGNFGMGDILRFNGTSGAFIDTFVATGSGGLGGPTFLVFQENAAVPEPSGVILALVGLAGIAVSFRLRRAFSTQSR